MTGLLGDQKPCITGRPQRLARAPMARRRADRSVSWTKVFHSETFFDATVVVTVAVERLPPVSQQVTAIRLARDPAGKVICWEGVGSTRT